MTLRSTPRSKRGSSLPSWLTKSRVIWARSHSSKRRRTKLSRVSASSAEVGSSAIKEGRAADERAGRRDALLLPDAQFGDPARLQLGAQTQAVQKPPRLRGGRSLGAHFLRAPPRECKGQRHIFQH